MAPRDSKRSELQPMPHGRFTTNTHHPIKGGTQEVKGP